jgi:uncharacterized protein (DUF2141 family)
LLLIIKLAAVMGVIKSGIPIILGQLLSVSAYLYPFQYCEPELQDKGYIELNISNIRNEKGVIRIGMYTNEIGYPDTPANGFTVSKDSLSGGRVRFIIPVNTAGTYGFSILDDENGNGKMDYFLGIIPREGFGFSNNPKVSRKAPSFDETSFLYEKGTKKVEIKMIYI